MLPFLEEYRQLNLPKGKHALFGSALLSVMNIRPAKDLDVIVKRDLWDLLSSKYPDQVRQDPLRIHIGNIEIFKDWMQLTEKIPEMIDSAHMIDDVPFVKLEYLLQWKLLMGRPQDHADILLIHKNRSVLESG